MGKRIILKLIRMYQATSAGRPATCRFTPSCSEYTRLAIEEYGVLTGGWLGLKRILRCHPFGKHGYDPVPKLERIKR